MTQDKFSSAIDSLTAPSSFCFAITPDDNADLTQATKAIYVGSEGDLTVMTVNSDTPVTFSNTISGSILDIRVQRVLATGTTAQNLVGLA